MDSASDGIMTGVTARLVGSRFENHGSYPSKDWTAWSVPGISSPNLTCGTGEDTPHTVNAVPHMARPRPHGKVSNSCIADSYFEEEGLRCNSATSCDPSFTLFDLFVIHAICHSSCERPKHCVLVLLPLIQNQPMCGQTMLQYELMCGQTMAISSVPLPCHTFLPGSNK